MNIRFKTFEEAEAFCDLHCFNTTKNYTICDEEVYVDCRKYPKIILDLNYLIPVTVLLVCMFLTGFLGNLSVCTVILKHPAMRTETNIYLFSLAVSDLLLLIFGLAPELSSYWQMYPYTFGNFLCKLKTFLATTGTWASVLTIVAFSIERYFAVCHPLRSRWPGYKRVKLAIFAIWTASIAIALPIWHAFKITMFTYPATGEESLLSQTCEIPDSEEYTYYNFLYTAYAIALFFIPLVILTVVYITIGLTLRKNSEMSRNCGILNNCAENKRIFRILVAVVLAFFICGAPFHYQRLVWSEGLKKQDEMVRDRIVMVITGIFYYLSATINPILYNAMSKRYRKAFKDIVWTKASPISQDGTLMNVTKSISLKKLNTPSN